MELHYLKPGHKIRMRDGTEAEVLSEGEDGEWIKVRYLDGMDDPLFGAVENLAHKDEIEALLGVAHKSTWGDRVAVIVHHVPESEESEGEYEAVTTEGIPHGVSVAASAPDSAEAALNRLLDGLRAFGFVGPLRPPWARGILRYKRGAGYRYKREELDQWLLLG